MLLEKLSEISRNKPKITVFKFVFLWALTVGLLIQIIILPYLLPSLHAGDGLMKGGDWIKFHEYSLLMADQIEQFGWSEWELKPYTWFPVGFASAIYYITGINSPWILLPFNAFLFSISAVFLFDISYSISKSKIFSIISIFPFVFFPSGALIYSQLHKDVFSVCGIMIIIACWIRLATDQKITLSILFKGSVLIFISYILIGLVRSYLFEVIAAVVIVGSISLLIFSSRNRKILWWVSVLVYLFISFMFIDKVSVPKSRYVIDEKISLNAIDEKISLDAIDGKISLDVIDEKALSIDSVSNFIFNKYEEVKYKLQFFTGKDNSWNVIKKEQIKATKVDKDSIDECRDGHIFKYFEAYLCSSRLLNKINKKVKAINAARKGFSNIEWASSTIDRDIKFNDISDIVSYIPRGVQISLLAPFPNSLFRESRTPGGRFMIVISIFEMTITYLLLIGVLFLFFGKNAKKGVTMQAFFMALTFSLVLAIAVSNLGSFYRMRFVSWHIINTIGVIGWLVFLSKNDISVFQWLKKDIFKIR